MEFTNEIREIKDIQQRNVERAIIGEGPYRVRNEYREDLEVNPVDWFHKMSARQRQQHIDKLMSTEVKPVEQEDAARAKPTDVASHLSVSFEDAGLSKLVHLGSWLKAGELVQKQNSIFPGPGTHQHEAFFVESTSGGPTKPNYVVMKPTGAMFATVKSLRRPAYAVTQSLCPNEMANWYNISSGLKRQNNSQIFQRWLLEELPAFQDRSPEEKDHEAKTEIPRQEMTASVLTTCQGQRSPFGIITTHSISCSLRQIRRSASHAREHSTKEVMRHLTCAYRTKEGTRIPSKETFTTSEKVLVKRTSTITLICLVYVAATHYSNLKKYP